MQGEMRLLWLWEWESWPYSPRLPCCGEGEGKMADTYAGQGRWPSPLPATELRKAGPVPYLDHIVVPCWQRCGRAVPIMRMSCGGMGVGERPTLAIHTWGT